MFKNRWIRTITLLLTVTGCVTATIPEAYNYKVNELQSNRYGCWTEIVVNTKTSTNKTISGELLNLSADSAFLLVADGKVRSIKNTSIISIHLYTHKNQANTYLATSAVFLSPAILGALVHPDYAGGFLTLGLPVAIVGIIQSIAEGSKKNNILIFPQKNRLNELAAFARYPAGMPRNMNYNLLYLRKL